jgi:hypothetical protein
MPVYDNGDNDEIEQYDVRPTDWCLTIDVDSTYSYKG